MELNETAKDRLEMLAAALLLGATAATSAYAQARDPAYQAARTDGLVGELPSGYLGYVVDPPAPAIKALVQDINIKRKAKYTEEALANGATVEEMALRTGCRLIRDIAVAGEKYKAPDGSWKTKNSAAPLLDPRCPR